MKNILFIHGSKNFSGGEKVTLEIAKHLVQGNEFTPFIGCLSENTEFIQAAKNFKIQVIELNINNISSFNIFKNLKLIFEVFFILKKHKINLVQTVDPVGFRYSAIGSFMAKVPTAFHFHYPYSNEGLNWFFNKLPKPRHFIFCCDSIRNKMSETLRNVAPSAKYITIHNGINLTLFSMNFNTSKRLPKNVAIIGNLQSRKGHKDFLHMAKFLEHKQGLKFHVVGDDVTGENNKKELMDLCKTLKIENSVIFHGFVDNIHQLLADMDILVCASYEEAFPLNILEAMAMGIPVVSTDVDGIPEAIEDGQTGFLVPTNSPLELANKVSFLLENNDHRIKIIEAANTLVKNNFSSIQFCNKFINFYKSNINSSH